MEGNSSGKESTEDGVVKYRFKLGDKVAKTKGDYRFKGVVVMRGRKRSGKPRFVVENSDGILHIFSESNLELIP